MRFLIVFVLLTSFGELLCQDVSSFYQGDTLFYKLDREAALNLIFLARKGEMLDYVVERDKRLLDSVLEGKIKSDAAQLILQNEVAEFRLRALTAEKELIQQLKTIEKLNNDKNRVLRNKNIILGFSVGIVSMFLITL